MFLDEGKKKINLAGRKDRKNIKDILAQNRAEKEKRD